MTGTFETTFEEGNDVLYLKLNADIPQLWMLVINGIESGEITLQGEALGKLIAWLQEPEYKLPR